MERLRKKDAESRRRPRIRVRRAEGRDRRSAQPRRGAHRRAEDPAPVESGRASSIPTRTRWSTPSSGATSSASKKTARPRSPGFAEGRRDEPAAAAQRMDRPGRLGPRQLRLVDGVEALEPRRAGACPRGRAAPVEAAPEVTAPVKPVAPPSKPRASKEAPDAAAPPEPAPPAPAADAAAARRRATSPAPTSSSIGPSSARRRSRRATSRPAATRSTSRPKASTACRGTWRWPPTGRPR